jgi:hypothetical protein
MMQLELPHINVITKCDIADKEQIEMVLDSEGTALMALTDRNSPEKLKRLTRAMSGVIEDYMIVSFVMLDITDESSLDEVLARIDHAIQYGEDLEPREPADEDMDNDGEH